ncbi:MAG: hypothetical protein JWO89_2505 [Verrucomicrobiaceae bacterium]|nr:hypothetical protein [Verrucomicrobiaceae bacterium]
MNGQDPRAIGQKTEMHDRKIEPTKSMQQYRRYPSRRYMDLVNGLKRSAR